jgi:lipopolysaccharide transport system permease protein
MTIYADLFRYWDLFLSLFRRELRLKYKGSLLGVAWSLFYPVVLMGVYTLVFSLLWKVVAVDDYPLFVLSGLLTWVFFQASVQAASTSLLAHANVLKQVRFPRQLIALSVVATQLVTFLVMLAIVLPINLILRPETLTTAWAVLPLSLALVAFVSGLSIAVSYANVIFRDIEHLLMAVMLPWFFLTPVFYTFDLFPGPPELIKVIEYGNVLVPFVEAIRDPLFFGRLPDVLDVVYVAVAAFGALALGALVFRRLDDHLAAEL